MSYYREDVGEDSWAGEDGTITITYRRVKDVYRDGYVLTLSRYSADAVAVIKGTVPPYARKYDASTREWTVDEEWFERVRSVLAAYDVFFEEASAHDRRSRTKPLFSASTAGACWDVLCLTPAAPVALVKSSYRILAQEYHPDRNDGIDVDGRFVRLRAAYEEAMKAKGAQP